MFRRRRPRAKAAPEGTEPQEWIVHFDRVPTEEQLRALEQAGLRRTKKGPPTGAPAISVIARSSRHAEETVLKALGGLDGQPFVRTHPPPRWIAKEAESQFDQFVVDFELDSFPAGREILRWAMMSYGQPPEELDDEREIMYWALMACHGVTPARGVDEALARHRLVAADEAAEFTRRWPPGGARLGRA